MTSNARRDLLAQAIIILAVCVGAWMVFVQPREKELAKIQQLMTDAGATAERAVTEQTVQQFADQIAAARERLARVQLRNRAADDSSQLYGLIMNLAFRCSVQVQTLNPGSVQNVSADGQVAVTPIEMNVLGGYQQVATFIEALHSIDGFIRPTSLDITPHANPSQGMVSARIACQALRFNLPEALAAVGDSTNATAH